MPADWRWWPTRPPPRTPLSWPRASPCSATVTSSSSAQKRPSLPWPIPAHYPSPRNESTYLAIRPADRDFRPKIATEVLSTARRQTCHAEERSISIQVATLASSKNSCLRMCDAHLLGLHHDKQVRDALHRRHRRPFAARLRASQSAHPRIHTSVQD